MYNFLNSADSFHYSRSSSAFLCGMKRVNSVVSCLDPAYLKNKIYHVSYEFIYIYIYIKSISLFSVVQGESMPPCLNRVNPCGSYNSQKLN